ncbi:hypothetical protein PR048_023439 [Dryococelus australis]|uniref:Uncharacterized protein n=1 Tax=Dryococelus australis TaxID=614101 RepID=A0ABQ9GU96_9NEOP|nr:hypothetical protein PR048_023439 [Dryococelus australis]
MKVATLGIAANAFRPCGIVPLNRYIFTDEDFLPSEATDQNCGINFDVIDTKEMSFISAVAQQNNPTTKNISSPEKKKTWAEISSSNGNSSQDVLGRKKKEARTGKEKQTITKILFQVKRKTSSRTTKTNQNTYTPCKPTGSKDKEVRCPSCDEVFVEPPSEELIQCSVCEEWWH